MRGTDRTPAAGRGLRRLAAAAGTALLLAGCDEPNPKCVAAAHRAQHHGEVVGLVIGIAVGIVFLAWTTADRSAWKEAFSAEELLLVVVLVVLTVAPFALTGDLLGGSIGLAHSTNCGSNSGLSQSFSGIDLAIVVCFLVPVSIGFGVLFRLLLQNILTARAGASKMAGWILAGLAGLVLLVFLRAM